MRLGDRLDGHLVQGHVDGVGTVRGRAAEGESTMLEIAPPPDLLRYVVEKGSIAVDGVSLTVAERLPDALHGRPDPPHHGRHDPRPAGRRARRSISRWTWWQNTWSRWRRPTPVAGRTPHDEQDRPVRHRRRRDRGDPRRPHGRHPRLRGPRERGRPRHGGPVRHARGHQLHGHPRPRADLPRAHRGALRPARPEADGAAQRGPQRDRLHRGRSRRATASPPASRRPTARARSWSRSTPTPGPRTSSSPGTCSRCGPSPAACSSAPATPRRRSTWRAWRA